MNYELSYWERDSFFSGIDIAVIGAGIVGLSAALHARALAPAARIAVFERGPLPIGASTRNAGFACFGSISELLDDMQGQPEQEVWALVEKRWQGLQRLRARLGNQQLRYEPLGGYELFQAEEQSSFEACASHIEAFNKVLKPMTGLGETYALAPGHLAESGIKGGQLICNRAEGQLHTGEMMRGLLELARAEGILLFAGLPVEALQDTGAGLELITGHGWPVKVGRALVATNGFAQQLLPELALRPARNQVLITAPIEGLRLRGCYHYDRGYYYFRNVGYRLLLGGGRQLNPQGEATSEFGTTPLIRKALLDLLQEVILPGQAAAVDCWWSGILGVGPQKVPIVQAVSDRVVAAVRLGGMGVAIGSLVGEEAADLLIKGYSTT